MMNDAIPGEISRRFSARKRFALVVGLAIIPAAVTPLAYADGPSQADDKGKATCSFEIDSSNGIGQEASVFNGEAVTPGFGHEDVRPITPVNAVGSSLTASCSITNLNDTATTYKVEVRGEGAGGDPVFSGYQYQTFQVHGVADPAVSMTSHAFLQYNAPITQVSVIVKREDGSGSGHL